MSVVIAHFADFVRYSLVEPVKLKL